MDNSFDSIVQPANSILILLPTKPFFDQVAGGLALYLALKGKKETAVSCPTEMLVEFNRLVGVDKVSRELGNKNLVVSFRDYKATGIERVSYDIENGEFRLTVIPKSGIVPPHKNQINFSYSGVSADVVILVGGVNESHFPTLSSKDLAGAKVVHVGLKSFSTAASQAIISFARPASSISELVSVLLKEAGYSFDPDIATNLLLGLEEGSNKFSSPGVTAETFQIIAELMRAGGRRRPVQPRPSFPAGAIPGQRLAQSPPHPAQTIPSSQSIRQQQAKEPPKEWIGPKIYKGTSVS